MNHTPDTAAADNGGTFGPEQAAALLGQTTQRARRKLEPSPPWLLATRGVLVLVALGVIWLSVRGQHPYKGPTAADAPILIGFVVLNFVATVGVRAHQIAGVSGRTRFSPAEIGILAASFAVAIVALVALSAAGASIGWYPTSVMVIPGVAWGAISVARRNWLGLATGIALVVLGIVGAFAGPAGSWAVAAVGLCAVMLANAVTVARHQHG
jgi:hypothetical protein